VLVAGGVSLQKGAPYVLEAARALSGLAEFRWCGAVKLLPEAARRLGQYVDLRGPVPRPQMAEHYAWADVFLLPSICEGSATVCYEALTAGLPVITTPNAGSVVRDGVEGFIVPVRNAEAIVERLERLARHQELLEEMSARALDRARQFTLVKYAGRLLAALRRVAAAPISVSNGIPASGPAALAEERSGAET
jgi:glycosyltransferase involved in cell wall biosynthesis